MIKFLQKKNIYLYYLRMLPLLQVKHLREDQMQGQVRGKGSNVKFGIIGNA